MSDGDMGQLTDQNAAIELAVLLDLKLISLLVLKKLNNLSEIRSECVCMTFLTLVNVLKKTLVCLQRFRSASLHPSHNKQQKQNADT
jgi:hypothetical protein